MYLQSKVIVYGFRNIETQEVYIGYKPAGKSHYVSSSGNADFWRDYSQGLLRQYILFIGDGYYEKDRQIAEALEWFALDYAFNVLGESKMYNSHNNAHKKHESLLTAEIKSVVVDWIEFRSDGIVLRNTYQEDRERVQAIVDRIKDKFYPVEQVSLSKVSKFEANQVRCEQYIRSHVNDIAQRIKENPDNYEKNVDPIVTVVGKDTTILDGNNTARALEKVPGISEAPVIFINETEFGETEEVRERCYNLFGLIMNKAPDVVRVENSNSDIKRQIQLLLQNENLDLTKPLHVDRARKVVEDFFLHSVIPTKQKLNGVWKSFMTDFAKGQSEKYRQNMKVYDDSYLSRYCWENYESKDVAVIHASMSKTEYAQAFAYVCRRMRNVDTNKGAIVLHYATPYEYQKYNDGVSLEDLKSTVEHTGLNIIVDVLPAFDE
jgi:hypothetical protein